MYTAIRLKAGCRNRDGEHAAEASDTGYGRQVMRGADEQWIQRHPEAGSSQKPEGVSTDAPTTNPACAHARLLNVECRRMSNVAGEYFPAGTIYNPPLFNRCKCRRGVLPCKPEGVSTDAPTTNPACAHASSQSQNTSLAEMWSGVEEGSYSRPIDCCITQL